MICYDLYPTPIGTLTMISDGKALTGLTFAPPEPQWDHTEDLSIFDWVRRWLDGYFSGNPTAVNFPIAPAGTVFRQQVWQILLTIPYGETVTYGAIAKQLGCRMSAQAVGQAVGKNPIAILIPCHRVIGSKGNMTGYAWGIEKKRGSCAMRRKPNDCE